MKDKKTMILILTVLGGIALGTAGTHLYQHMNKGHADNETHNEHGHKDDDHDDKKEKHDAHDEKGHGGHEEQGGKDVVTLDGAEMKEFGIEVAAAGPGKLESYVNLPGEVVVNPDRLAHIVPRVPGIVLKVRKTLGDGVRKGEIMAVLESAELGQAKIEYLTARQQLELARVDMDRMKTIHDNTEKMLDMLKSSPDPEILQEKTKGLDMGENRSSLISAYTTLILTRATHKREKNLYEKKISSQADLLEAERDYKTAQAGYSATYDEISFAIKRQLLDTGRAVSVAESSLQAAERHLHILGLTDKDINSLQKMEKHDTGLSLVEIRSPFQGTVIEKHITLGEMLESNSTTFVVADLKTVWVNLSVYQKDLFLIQKGQQAIISAGHTIPDIIGKVSWIRPMVGEETRTAIARVVLPNPDGLLLPGLFVNGKIAVKSETVSFLIPRSALQTVEEKTSVFVKTDEGFELRTVKTGRKDEISIEIISGLTLGEKYVKKGAFTLKAQLSKGAFGDGHNH